VTLQHVVLICLTDCDYFLHVHVKYRIM